LQLGKQSRASKLHDEVNPKRGKACANDLQLGKQSEAVETQFVFMYISSFILYFEINSSSSHVFNHNSINKRDK
jgi:hypothetical protein